MEIIAFCIVFTLGIAIGVAATVSMKVSRYRQENPVDTRVMLEMFAALNYTAQHRVMAHIVRLTKRGEVIAK
jgi:hypothetical protein